MACNILLLNRLLQEDVEYQTSEIHADALALAIRISNCSGSAENDKKFELIETILRFNPPIKQYHRQRMAELRLQNFARYEKITDRFPELKIAENQTPAGAYCSYVKFEDGSFYLSDFDLLN